MKNDPYLSVVVIGHNEGKNLSRCLESVRNSAGIDGEIEIIYVDSASTDDSVERAKKQGVLVFDDRNDQPSAASARNVGWRAANGNTILFLDGDTVVDPRFVQKGLQSFTHDKIAIVWGHRREIYPQHSLYNQVLDLDWIYPPGPSDFCGGDFLVLREVLEKVNGFDTSLLAGEEPELCRRIRARGYEILHIDEPMTGHDHGITRFSQYWNRAHRSGFAYANVADRYQDTEDPFWKREMLVNRIHGVIMAVLPIAFLFFLVAYLSIIPVFVILVLLVAARTAWRARWKADSWQTLWLYALHSHFQQIPILVGQCSYWLDRWRRKRERV